MPASMHMFTTVIATHLENVMIVYTHNLKYEIIQPKKSLTRANEATDRLSN
jgi:hypothetical protein